MTWLIFGVSGLLYDRNTGSQWSQILAKAVSGKLQGTRLQQLPAVHTTWGSWRANHPASEVLDPDTGFRRDYDESPYGGYEQSPRLYFRVSRKSPRTYHPKALVLGVELSGLFKAYPFDELNEFDGNSFGDLIGQQAVTLHWDAFHPDTLVFKAPETNTAWYLSPGSFPYPIRNAESVPVPPT